MKKRVTPRRKKIVLSEIGNQNLGLTPNTKHLSDIMQRVRHDKIEDDTIRHFLRQNNIHYDDRSNREEGMIL